MVDTIDKFDTAMEIVFAIMIIILLICACFIFILFTIFTCKNLIKDIFKSMIEESVKHRAIRDYIDYIMYNTEKEFVSFSREEQHAIIEILREIYTNDKWEKR